MIRKTWDKEKVLTEFFDCENFSDILNKIKDQCEERKEVLCEVKLNEELLSEAQEVDNCNMRLSEIWRLDIVTAEPDQLVQETITSTKQFITELQEIAYQTSDLYLGKDLLKAVAEFEKLLTGSDWLIELLLGINEQAASLAKNSPTSDTVNDAWKSAETEYSNVLSKVMQACKGRDFHRLANLLDYDLTNAMEAWVDFLEHIEEIYAKREGKS